MATYDPATQALIDKLLSQASPAMQTMLQQAMAPQTPVTPTPQEAEEPGGLWNNIKLGALNMGSQLEGAKLAAGGYSPEQVAEFADAVAKNAQEAQKLVPPGEFERMNELLTSTRTEGEGWAPQFGEVLRDLWDNPDLGWKLIAQQAPALATTMIAALGGAAAAGPIGAAAGAGTTSGVLSAGGFMADYLSRMGVNMADANEIKLALEIPGVYEDMRERAARYGIGVGAFDAVAMGMAGRALGAGFTAKTFAKEAAASAALGMAGEGAGQAAALEGKVSPPDVFVEGALELATGPVEAIVGKITNRVKQDELARENEKPTKPDLSDASITEEEIQLPPEQEAAPAPEATPTEAPSEKPVTVDAQIKAAEQAPKQQEKQQDAQIQPVEYPKSIIKGTYRSRRNKLFRESKSDLASTIAKYNIQVKDKAKKGDMADAILAHFGITPNSKPNQLPKLPVLKANEPTPPTAPIKTHTVEVPTQPNQPAAVAKVEVTPQTEPNELLATGKAAYSKGAKGKFSVKFPSLFEKAVYNSKRFKGKKEGNEARAWLKDQYKLDDTQIDSFAEYQDRMLSQAPAGNNVIESPTLFQQSASQNAAKTEIGKVTVKPVNTDPVQNKAALIKSAGVAPEVVANMTPTDAVMLNTTQQIAKEGGNEQDLVDAYGATLLQLIRDFVGNMPRLVVKEWDGEVRPLTLYKKLTVQVQSMINAARTMPFMAPLVSAHDAVSTVRQSIINLGMARAQELEVKYGLPRIRKVGQVLVWMQKTDQELRQDAQGRAYYKNEDGKLVALDPQTSKALRDMNKFFKAQPMYYIEEARIRLAEMGFNSDVTIEELEAQLQTMRDAGTSEVGISEMESLINIIKLKQKFDSNPNKVYFPRYRNSGPFAVGFYAKIDPNKPASGDNLQLRHFSSVEAKYDGSAFNQKDFQRVVAKAEKDRTTAWKGETWYTADGRPMAAAEPFLMTVADIVKKLSSNAFSTELLASLLTMKGLDPAKLQQVLTAFSNAKEGAKLAYRFTETQNYSGYNEDIEDVIASSIAGTAATFTRFKYNNDLTRIGDLTKKAAARSGDAGPAGKFVSDYTEYLLSPNEAASAIREFQYLWALGGNFSSAALQLMALPLNYSIMSGWTGATKRLSMPILAKTMADVAHATPKVMRHYRLLSDPSLRDEFKRLTKLSQPTVDLMYKLKDAGVLDALLAADLAQKSGASIAQRRRHSWAGKLPAALQGPADTIQRKAGGMITYVESASRISTALMTIRSIEDPAAWARAQEWAKQDPYFSGYLNTVYKGQLTKARFVELLVKDLHGSFGKENRPQLLRGELGTMIWPLATFMFHNADSVWNIMKTTPKGRQAFVAFMLTLIAVGGVKALPFFGTGDEVWKWLNRWYAGRTTDLEKDVGLALQWMGADTLLTSTLLRGTAYSVAGINISERIRPTGPGIFKIVDTAGNLLNATNPEDIFGIAGATVGGIKQAANAYAEGSSPLPALKSALPAVIRNVISASSIAQNDVRSMRGTKLLDYEQVDPATGERYLSKTDQIFDAVRQGLGFSPSLLAEARRLNYLGKQSEYAPLRTQYANEFAGLARDAVAARKSGDKEALAVAVQEMVELNRDMKNRLQEIWEEEGKLAFDPSTMTDSVMRKLLADEFPEARPTTVRKTDDYQRNVQELSPQYLPPVSQQTPKEMLQGKIQ